MFCVPANSLKSEEQLRQEFLWMLAVDHTFLKLIRDLKEETEGQEFNWYQKVDKAIEKTNLSLVGSANIVG